MQEIIEHDFAILIEKYKMPFTLLFPQHQWWHQNTPFSNTKKIQQLQLLLFVMLKTGIGVDHASHDNPNNDWNAMTAIVNGGSGGGLS